MEHDGSFMRVRCSLWDDTSNSILIFNPYFEFENDTGKKPNRQQYYVGLAVYVYYSMGKK